MGVFRQQKALDRLEDRMQRLEQKCDDLDRSRKGLDMEFTELYDKVSHQMSRMAKRYARAEKETPNDAEVEVVDESLPDTDPVSRSILLRRGTLGRSQ